MMNDTALKMFMDQEVAARLAEAKRGYELRRARRLSDLLGAIRRVQDELDLADHAAPAETRRLSHAG